jgi:tetratricopeptide (TPR) repeat protein
MPNQGRRQPKMTAICILANSIAKRMMGIKTAVLLGFVLTCLTINNARAATDTSANLARIAKALSQGNPQAAERLVAAALAQPGLSGLEQSLLLLDRAKIDELEDRLGDGLTDFTRAIESHALPQTDQMRALLERGLLLDALNRLDDAIEDYNTVLELDPHSANALNSRASVYRRQNRTAEARRDYLASLAAGATNPEYSYFGLGQIAETQGDRDAARGLYVKAVAANPKYSLALDRLKNLGGIPAAPLSAPSAPTPELVTSGPSRLPVISRSFDRSAGQSAHLRPLDIASAAHPIGQGLRPALADDETSHKNNSQVQLGVWSSEGAAAAAWARAVQLAGKTLAALSPSIVPVDLQGKGSFFRLRVTAADAISLCASLKSVGVDCMPVRQ